MWKVRQPDRQAREMRLLQQEPLQLLHKGAEKEESGPQIHMQRLLEQYNEKEHVQER
jgi:hypothetical protein